MRGFPEFVQRCVDAGATTVRSEVAYLEGDYFAQVRVGRSAWAYVQARLEGPNDPHDWEALWNRALEEYLSAERARLAEVSR